MLHPESQYQSVYGGPQEQPWRLGTVQNGVNISAYLDFLGSAQPASIYRNVCYVS